MHSHDNDGCHSHDNQNLPIASEKITAQYQQEKHRREVKSAFANYAKDMRTSLSVIYGNDQVGKYYQLVRERKRQQFEIALEANQKFLNLILKSAEQNQPQECNTQKPKFVSDQVTMCHNISKIRTTVKQFFRQWCQESEEIKDYQLLVEAAKKYIPTQTKILVPGCGLARLALQLIEAGYNTQGNQVTYFMLYGSNFILNCVERKEQFQIYPFIHTLNNHETEEDMFRSVRVPDKLALEVVAEDVDFSMAAGQFTEIYQIYPEEFDGLITCFFIDTANNVFEYIDTIFSVLKAGGIWINYGPLLYHFQEMMDQISVQLSWDQVKSYAVIKGFSLVEEQKKQTTYCHDPKSSYTHLYQATLSVWRKLENTKTRQNI